MKRYKVYSIKDNSLLAEGTSHECQKALGFVSVDSFYAIASLAKKGKSTKYIVEIEDDE